MQRYVLRLRVEYYRAYVPLSAYIEFQFWTDLLHSGPYADSDHSTPLREATVKLYTIRECNRFLVVLDSLSHGSVIEDTFYFPSVILRHSCSITF